MQARIDAALNAHEGRLDSQRELVYPRNEKREHASLRAVVGSACSQHDSGDMWRASKKAMNLLSVNRGNKLSFMGFSAGGHAIFATLRQLQSEGVNVTAVAATGSVLDPEAFFSLGATVKQTPKPAFYCDLKTNPHSEMRVRLRQNAVDEWHIDPGTPIREYHSRDDAEVAYADTVTSIDKLRARGASIVVKHAPVGYSHYDTWYQAMPKTVTWFRSF